MAWFGDGLPSLSNLKGQITNFTKEVLSEGIVEEIDERSKELKEANQKCVELQEILNSKDAEISLLRRQNCELQKGVIELNARSKDSSGSNQDDESETFFWDPPSSKNRNSRNQNHARQLQEQLAQATVKIRDLESELKRVQKINASALKEELADGHQKAEFLRAKQDMVNRIIQMEEKNRETERNARSAQSDESPLVSDFRTALSKLNTGEKQDILRSALKALEIESEKYSEANEREKSDFDEKFKGQGDDDHQNVAMKTSFEMNSGKRNSHDGFIERPKNREAELHEKIDELQRENKRLFASIEELDQQHEESIEKLLSLKEEIERKHQCLQTAYEQLYVDYNQAQEKVSQLEKKFSESNAKSRAETISRSVETERTERHDKVLQTSDSNAEKLEEKSERIAIDELTVKVKDILKCTSVAVESNESIFEAVAKRYVDAKWKQDVLEKRVTELNRDLKAAVEMKENLQAECDVMQSHIDSLLLEVQDLKLNLPSIPEASEERVACLESETESLHEELSRLQTRNAVLERENAILRGDVSRLEDQGSTGILNRSRKLIKLENIPEDVEDTDGTSENHRMNAILDENDELRQKIDLLENSEKEMREQLRMSLEKCKGLDENIEFIEELKLDLENARLKLKSSTSNGKQLENDLAALRDAKNEIQKENEELSRRNEVLEEEITKWRASNSEIDSGDTLKSLQEQLNRTVREKNDLEVDFRNARRELDAALDRIEAAEGCVARLSQEKEILLKEKSSLIEQLTATQDESNDKIDLVSTEKSLLEQEQTELRQKVESSEAALNEVAKRLRDAEECYGKLEREYLDLGRRAKELQSENENLRNRKHREAQHEEELARLTEKLASMQNDYAQLSNEAETLRLRERELIKLQESFARVAEENTSLRNECETVRVNCGRLEENLAALRAEKEELLNRVSENVRGNEREEMAALLEEKAREIDVLRADNEKLIAEVVHSQKRLQETVDGSAESSHMAKETIESLSHLVREKDEEINGLKRDLDLARINGEASEQFTTLKNERDELVKLVTVKHHESLQYHGEIQRLTHLLNEQTSRLQNLLGEKDAILAESREREAEILWTKNELLAAQQRLKNAEGSSETCGIVEHSTLSAEVAILREKCEALEAALVQEQSNYRILQNQLIESQNKEASAAKELERLRTHLVEMESSYTEEALLAEETRKELEAKLQQAEEKMKSSSTAYTSANIRANQQVETLQQQMALIVQQRDDIQNKLSAAEDKILSQTASLTNLQIVLEQFQQDKERDIITATGRIQSKLVDSYKKQEEMANEMANLKEQLVEARECLQAASRLSEQLDKKTERIEQLTQEVDRLTSLVNTADRRIEDAKQTGEGKVDKNLVKNLLLGYLSSSAADKSSVLRVFSTVLEFTDAEKDKAGLNNTAAQNSWFSRLSSGSTTSNKDQEASLSAAFVRFLENESKPKPQLPALPIQSSGLSRPGHSRQHSTSSTQSTLLLSNVNLPTFPDFVPARNTGSILKEVLKDS